MRIMPNTFYSIYMNMYYIYIYALMNVSVERLAGKRYIMIPVNDGCFRRANLHGNLVTAQN